MKRTSIIARLIRAVVAEGEEEDDGNADAVLDAMPEGGRFDGAPTRYWMCLTSDGAGHHIGPVLRRPASHACVRGPSGTIPIVYSNVLCSGHGAINFR